jgi:hypothetical protein
VIALQLMQFPDQFGLPRRSVADNQTLTDEARPQEGDGKGYRR